MNATSTCRDLKVSHDKLKKNMLFIFIYSIPCAKSALNLQKFIATYGSLNALSARKDSPSHVATFIIHIIFFFILWKFGIELAEAYCHTQFTKRYHKNLRRLESLT